MRYITSLSIKKVNEEHVHHFVRSKLGKLYNKLQEDGNSIVFQYSNAKMLPDNFMDIDVYCKFADLKRECWYDLTS